MAQASVQEEAPESTPSADSPPGTAPDGVSRGAEFFDTMRRWERDRRGTPRTDPRRDACWDRFVARLRDSYQLWEGDAVTMGDALGLAVGVLRYELCVLDAASPMTECVGTPRDPACVAGFARGRALRVGSGADPSAELRSVGSGDLVFAEVGVDTAGNARPGFAACVALGVRWVVYRDADGVHAVTADLDATPADGISLGLPLGELALSESIGVAVVDLWLGPSGEIVHGAVDVLPIRDGAEPGDWDRDGDVGPDDILGFMGAAEREVPRADLTGDGSQDKADMLMFLEAYAAGRAGVARQDASATIDESSRGGP